MLQQVCEFVLNYFVKDSHYGTYAVASGAVSPVPDLLDGQRFRIVGSALNDGVYTYHPTGINDDDDTNPADLSDETFTGSIQAMAVPKSFLALSAEIAAWQTEYGAAVSGPYQSENVIGVYSYTLKSGGNGGSGGGAVNWQSQFRDRLNRWRKVCL